MLVQDSFGCRTEKGADLMYWFLRVFCGFQEQYHDLIVCTRTMFLKFFDVRGCQAAQCASRSISRIDDRS